MTVSIVTSVLVGYMTLYFPKAGLFVMGMWVGFFLSFVLNNVALYHIKSNPPALPLMISMGVLGLGMGVLSLFVKKSFVIFSTCNHLIEFSLYRSLHFDQSLELVLRQVP